MAHEDNISDAKEIEIQEVSKPRGGNLRRHSTGAIGTTKPQIKSRYRGNHHVSSTHDFCKKCDLIDAVKPWTMVKRRSVEGSDVVKVETSSGLRRHSLGSRQIPVTKLGSSVDAKRDVLALKKTPCASVTSETYSTREDREMARSVDGSRVKSNAKAWKNREPQAMEKAPRIKDGESLKVCSIKNVKNKEKAYTQKVRGEDVKEKTVCVVESIIKVVQRDKQTSSEKKTMRIGQKSLTKKEEGGYADLDADPKPERTNFKRGKVLEKKPEDSGESSKCEKVVLKHQNVEKEKKIMTLFNSVIEETMIKLMKLKKTKVEALTGAYESLIQDTKKSQHIRSKATTSKVSSFGFRTVRNKNTET